MLQQPRTGAAATPDIHEQPLHKPASTRHRTRADVRPGAGDRPHPTRRREPSAAARPAGQTPPLARQTRSEHRRTRETIVPRPDDPSTRAPGHLRARSDRSTKRLRWTNRTTTPTRRRASPRHLCGTPAPQGRRPPASTPPTCAIRTSTWAPGTTRPAASQKDDKEASHAGRGRPPRLRPFVRSRSQERPDSAMVGCRFVREGAR